MLSKSSTDGLTVKTTDGDIAADAVLLAAGRRPRTTGIDLEGLGITTGRGGAVTVDSHMKTSAGGIYAVGDVTGGYMLAHAAYAEADVAATNILRR